jgi:hypothetical protein
LPPAHGPTAEVAAEKAIMAEVSDTTKATKAIPVTIMGPAAITDPVFPDTIITITTTTIPNDTTIGIIGPTIGIIGRPPVTGMDTTATECSFPLAIPISILDSVSAASDRPWNIEYRTRNRRMSR